MKTQEVSLNVSNREFLSALIMSNFSNISDPSHAAKLAVTYADALISHLNKKQNICPCGGDIVKNFLNTSEQNQFCIGWKCKSCGLEYSHS